MSCSEILLPINVLEKIDSICDRLEKDCVRCGSVDLAEYLQELDSRYHSALLRELIPLHMDYEFRRRLSDQTNSGSHASPLGVETYLQTLPSIADQPEVVCDLIRAEFVLRHRLGESVDPGELATRFPNYPAATKELPRLLWELSPVVFTVDSSPERFDLSSPLEFGRQNPGEPPPICRTIDSNDNVRLIVAPSDDRSVSRSHVRVCLKARALVEVEGLSAHSSTYLNRSERIDPREKKSLKVPGLLHLGPIKVSFTLEPPA